ncbi:MAG: Pr6Pr family membrane protein [Clostridiales bacterium]|nr:Pr6Pr family membrane protein [Clostridiales bacterium]
MEYNARPLMKNKPFGAFLLLTGIIGFAIIVMRIVCYEFEFVPGYYEVDYGRFNFFSYFTVQSNIYVSFYLVCLALAVFGNERAKKIAFNPMVRLTVTTYILVTGAVYCGGIPMKMTPPLYWDNFQHIMLGTVQVFHHMIMPPFMLILFLIPPTQERIRKRKLWIVAVYPFVYSVFSIIRGAVSNPEFYPYPFYRPEFFWNIFLKGREMNAAAAYLLMLPMLLMGMGVFILIAFVLTLIYNKICKKMTE